MKTITSKCEDLYIINKSKFISFAYPVTSDIECKDILKDLGTKYSDATHICYAYILTSPSLEKCSDNGEPSGTAGRPILEVLKKKNLENILCVVIRYFGGKKLGAGGLIRAYSTSAVGVIDKCEIVENEKKIRCRVLVDIKDGERIKRQLSSLGADIININYSNDVEIIFDTKEKIDLIKYNIEVV